MTALRLPGRVLEPERMDTEPVTVEELARAHADLDRLTALGFSHRPTIQWLGRLARGRDRLAVLDVGCGGGDMLRRVAVWGRRRGLALRLEGVDINPDARAVAERATPPELGIRYHTADALALGAELEPDAIISAHFAHHLSDDGLVAFLRWMEATAGAGWFINDLHRHAVPHRFLQVAPRLLGYHPFVVSDGPISVRRAFVRADWEGALAAAGIPADRVEIRWYLPFRWGVGTRPEA